MKDEKNSGLQCGNAPPKKTVKMGKKLVTCLYCDLQMKREEMELELVQQSASGSSPCRSPVLCAVFCVLCPVCVHIPEMQSGAAETEDSAAEAASVISLT
ncbi:hypothetical protein M5D96_003257 [Drosophila gunungcola]|uniref:Uncharacterized protein n=1 Tax=Drosophila gunungcola TaxID=103775 RepID=A0A9Q0BRY6_9MUSC|nr:hypothetical protein M5D96_003257 [Drosophila gunungcola]